MFKIRCLNPEYNPKYIRIMSNVKRCRPYELSKSREYDLLISKCNLIGLFLMLLYINRILPPNLASRLFKEIK